MSPPPDTLGDAPRRKRAPVLASVLASAALVACGGGEGFQPRELSMTRLGFAWAPTELRQTYALRSEAEWQAAWQVHAPRTTPPAAPPAVDFSRQMVLGLTQGSGPNGCHGLSIRRVIEQAEQLQVQYAVTVPASDAGCTQAIVPLTDFVVVERLDKPVAFLPAGG